MIRSTCDCYSNRMPRQRFQLAFQPVCALLGLSVPIVFITNDSYVAYEFAMQRLGAFVDRQVEVGNYIQKADASEELVEKICAGLKKSPFAKRRIKDDYDATLRAIARRKKAAE